MSICSSYFYEHSETEHQAVWKDDKHWILDILRYCCNGMFNESIYYTLI
jgi:hypothetical protein